MIREVFERREHEVSVGIADTRIASVRQRDEVETVVRVYDDGRIGLASAVGRADIDALTAAAVDTLAIGVPHAPGPNLEGTSETRHAGTALSAAAFVERADHLLAELRTAWPRFVFSHRISHSQVSEHLTNDAGVDHRYERTDTQIVLLYKRRGSPGILDGMIPMLTPGFDDLPGMLDAVGRVLGTYDRPTLDRPAGRQRVVFAGLDALYAPFQTNFMARMLRSGGSLFSDGVKRPFAATLVDTRDATRFRVRPWDDEGTVRAEPDHVLVSGERVEAIASRRDGHRFDVAPTANASGPLRSVPGTVPGDLKIRPTAPRLVDLLGGEGAILVDMAVGGDCSPAGDYGLPVQLAYQLDASGQRVARLPELNLVGSVWDVFGEGFVGATEERVSGFSEEGWVVVEMTVA